VRDAIAWVRAPAEGFGGKRVRTYVRTTVVRRRRDVLIREGPPSAAVPQGGSCRLGGPAVGGGYVFGAWVVRGVWLTLVTRLVTCTLLW